MSQAIDVDQHVSERLTWKQICERYPDEWVVLVETEWVNDTDFDFGTATVLGHFKSRKQAAWGIARTNIGSTSIRSSEGRILTTRA